MNELLPVARSDVVGRIDDVGSRGYRLNMEVLSSLERALLDVIALQVPEVTDALAGQRRGDYGSRANPVEGVYERAGHWRV